MKTNRGLSKELVLALSKQKQEPKWVLDLRLKGLELWDKLEMPSWSPKTTAEDGDNPEEWLDLSNIETYVKPRSEMADSWDKVPSEVRDTFEKLGIPQAEREGLAGVGAQYDSETIYHRLKAEAQKQGVVYLPIEEALRSKKYSKLVREHFMKLIPPEDHKYAALHAAIWSGGSFIYVPKNTSVEIPLQSYYRLNAPGAGQFEHTLIILDEGADLHFIEGCSAPKYNIANLHAGSVELYVGKNAHLKFSTVESWSKNMFNLNTKRAIVEEGGFMEWVTGSFGSKVSMLYPMTILNGANAREEFTGISFAGKGQILDTGAKVVLNAPNTSAVINAKSISKDGGNSITRTLIKITDKATDSKAYSSCKSLIVDKESKADAIPILKVDNKDSEAAHEASVGKISEEAVFYLKSRGISDDEARAMIVRGFVSEVSKELPVEYAMEMNELIKLEMEGLA